MFLTQESSEDDVLHVHSSSGDPFWAREQILESKVGILASGAILELLAAERNRDADTLFALWESAVDQETRARKEQTSVFGVASEAKCVAAAKEKWRWLEKVN